MIFGSEIGPSYRHKSVLFFREGHTRGVVYGHHEICESESPQDSRV